MLLPTKLLMSHTMRFLSYLSTLLIAVLLAACGGGGGSPGAVSGGGVQSPALFTTAPANLTLGVGSSQDFSISGGRAPYTAVTNNAGVAVGGVNGTSLTLGGVSAGSAEITVRDAAGASSTVSVTVNTRPLFTTAPASITVASGSSPIYSIGGGIAPYTATSSNASVATASVSGSSLSITGVALGAASVVVRDSVGGVVTLAVTVPSASSLPLFTTAPASVTLAVGTSTTYTIGGGSGPYTATSSNTSAVTTSLSGTALTLRSVANGAAIVLVRDAAGATVSIAATVNATQMGLNPTTVNAFIGDIVYTAISGGTPPYNVVQGFPDAAEATIGTLAGNTFTPNVNGDILRVVVKQTVASGILVVRDANGNSANFTLTASAGTNQISLSPSALTISEQGTFTITPILYGAFGTVNLFSSDPTLITVTTPVSGTASGTPVTIVKQNSCVSIDTDVTITAIDGTGAKATSVITIRDNPNPACL